MAGPSTSRLPVRLRLCPVLTVDRDGSTLSGSALGSRKARTLLALLAVGRGTPVGTDRLAWCLWGDHPPADPPANVATLVSRLRRTLGDGLISAVGHGYALDVTADWTLDLDDAARLCAEAAARSEAGEALLAAAAARSALALLGDGPTLDDTADAADTHGADGADWVEAIRREAAELRRRGRHLLVGALAVADPHAAVLAAATAAAVDPFDERAARDLMRALVADGRTAAALATYDELVVRLRDDLGTTPDRDSAALHLEVLRAQGLHPERPVGRAATAPDPPGDALVGREAELLAVDGAWSGLGSAAAPTLLVVRGEAGIGKTRLLEAAGHRAAATGGLVLDGRCHPTERSLFLQPFVDALRPALTSTSPSALHALVGGHEDAWASMVPELADVLPASGDPVSDADLRRRRCFDAVAATLDRLSRDRPVLLRLDDLQDSGAASVDLLGHLGSRLGTAPVLLLGAVRSDDDEVVPRLGARAVVLDLAGLSRSDVAELAAAAGVAGSADQVMERTAGHSLSVVESLSALASGEVGVPESLTAAVLGRVDRLPAPARAVLEAAAVLHRRLAPRLLAELVATTEIDAARRCEELVRRGLLVRSATSYEFTNDLFQEVVHRALPPAVSRALHRAAADLVADRPEAMAVHAAAAGDEVRAARGWLLAGEQALARAAVDDAGRLLQQALDVAAAPDDVRARALLARSSVREARTAYDAAMDDVRAALAIARTTGDQRLEMSALRALGGDSAVAMRLPVEAVAAPLEAGLRLAAHLGDRRAEADFSTRLTVVDASRLRLAAGLARAGAAVARARATGSTDAVMVALDGLKTVLCYLGDADPLEQVLGELEPLVRARRDTWLLQWVVMESAFVPAARGDLALARTRLDQALQLNAQSGFAAYAGYLLAHDGWFARLAGEREEARSLGRRALSATSPEHPWWFATAAGMLAATLVELGTPADLAEARAVARRGLDVADDSVAAGARLRCAAALAALGDGGALDEAERLLDAAECPPGQAWVGGADCYLLLAAAHRDRGDAAAAARTLTPLADAVAVGWGPVRRQLERFAGAAHP